MVTRKRALVVLAVVGAVVGVALACAVFLGPISLYAARRAQIFDEPARELFVAGAGALAAIPVLAVISCVAFRLARASAPVRRGLTAWGLSILLAGAALILYFVLSFVLFTQDSITEFRVMVVVHALASAALWVAVARRRWGTERMS